MIKKDKLTLLEKAVKELLDYKIKSEANMNSLEKEVKSLKTTSFNDNKTQRSKLPEVVSISNEFAKLKSEFELLKLCQRNQVTKSADDKNTRISSKKVKCNTCESVYQKEFGLKVHNNLVHNREPASKES